MDDFLNMSFNELQEHVHGTTSFSLAPSPSTHPTLPALPSLSNHPAAHSRHAVRSPHVARVREPASGIETAGLISDMERILSSLGGLGIHFGGRPTTPGMSYEELLRLDEANVRRGVSQAERARLPVYAATSAESSQECQVCKDRMAAGLRVMKLPCDHIYHEACISQWFDANRTCPVCRREIGGR
eukprot:tig00000319_g24123.t1